ncbi:MAG: glycosyltransferase family 2 protein [Geminicoccaceae bacterium]
MINYNGEGYLRASLPAALGQADRFEEILLVDNGSTDGSLDLLAREFPTVRVVRLGQNRGAGAARNVGVREARTDLILFLDNDVLLLEGCIERLVDALRDHPDAIAAAPSVLYAKLPDVVQYCGADNHYLGLMILRQENTPLAQADTSIRRTESLVTACFLIDRSRLVDDHPFDEIYFYHMEDHDLGVRLRALGHAILAVPEAHVLHGEGQAGLSIRRIGKYTPTRVYFLIRNRWLFLFKTYKLRSLILLSPMLFFYECAQLVMVIKKGWAREWARAAGWIISEFPTLLDLRRSVQTTRKVPDRELFSDGPIPFRTELASGRLELAGRRALDFISSRYFESVRRFL